MTVHAVVGRPDAAAAIAPARPAVLGALSGRDAAARRRFKPAPRKIVPYVG
jgi:hypothetical protein